MNMLAMNIMSRMWLWIIGPSHPAPEWIRDSYGISV